MREVNGSDRASKAAFSLATATNVRYHGGPVLQSGTDVVAVYWGSPGYANLPSGSGVGTDDSTSLGSRFSTPGLAIRFAARPGLRGSVSCGKVRG